MSQALLTDNSPMPFGKYKDKAMVNVPAVYLIWLYEQGVSHQGVKAYIEQNWTVLKNEVSRIPNKK